jgi:ATP-binding cassette subfamily B (MDR/TAP) protein 1
MYTGERQAGRIRAKYVHAILRQNVGYFDTQGGNIAAIVASVSADTLLLQDAISEKVSSRNLSRSKTILFSSVNTHP